jgi:hypothetical protein
MLGSRRTAVALVFLAFVFGAEARVGVVVNHDLWTSSPDVRDAVNAYVQELEKTQTVWLDHTTFSAGSGTRTELQALRVEDAIAAIERLRERRP